MANSLGSGFVMLSKEQAQSSVEETFPGVKVKAWTTYRKLFLFRVEHASELEKDWDPFFSVDPVTGETRDFSVITDGNIQEIAELDWKNVK
jgi:hypothetical protein